MTQFTPQNASNTAMLIKQMVPNIDDARLSQLVQQAAAVQNDPVRSQAFAQKLQSYRQADGGIVDNSGENDNGSSDAGTVQQSFIPTGSVSSDIPPSYAAPGVANQDLTSSLGQAGAGLQQGNINNVQAANALAAQTGNLANQQAAERAYQQSIANLAPARSAANFMAATGGPQVAAQSSASWDKLNEQNKDLTLGAVSRQQDFAKNAISNYQAGVTMAGNVLDQMDKSGKFNIDANAAALAQKKLQLELIGHAATAENTQALMDPASPMSIAARNGAKKTLQLAGYDTATISKMVPDNMPGIQAAPIAAATGTTLANMKTVADTLSTQATTGKTQAETQQLQTGTAGMKQGQTFGAQQLGMPAPDYSGASGSGTSTPTSTTAPVVNAGPNATPTFGFNPNSDLSKVRAAMAGQPANVLAAFDKQYPNASGTNPLPSSITTQNAGAPKMIPSMDSKGNISWSPGSYAQAAGTNAQNVLAGMTQEVSAYKTTSAPSIQSLVLQAPSMGGYNLRNTIGMPLGNTAAQNYMNNISKLNEEAVSLGLISPTSGSSMKTGVGTAISSMGGAIAHEMPGLGTALAAGGHLVNGGQAISATTNPATVQQLAIAVQEARLKQEAMIPYISQQAARNSGDISGAVVPEPINQSATLVNPQTGEVKLAYTPDEAKAMIKQGWQTKNNFLGNK